MVRSGGPATYHKLKSIAELNTTFPILRQVSDGRLATEEGLLGLPRFY